MDSFGWVPEEGDTEGLFCWIKTGKGTEVEGPACVKAQRSETVLEAGRTYFVIGQEQVREEDQSLETSHR